MNSFKRLFVSIKSQIDHVADEFENHEALAETAIGDLQEIARKTRLHLHRVDKMTEQYQKQLQKQQEQARLWSERALKIKQQDEQKALQCVRRLRQAQRQSHALEQQIQEAKTQAAKIRDDLSAIQEQLLVLKNKKEILAARQHRTSVHDVLLDRQANPLRDAQSIFDRWEGSVVSSEFDLPETIDSDIFAEQFEQEEDELALKMMLDELEKTDSATK
ncbi:PspA/IM30 family protein [Methylomarinum vadi]|uniref:PspA/IM30 family protein n=1 Tax=Methylomarinum vadi TaxID=438855 RepID=UPI0004DF2A66|nr:PspA/IM30 family protein [Methylomarinum vadi]